MFYIGVVKVGFRLWSVLSADLSGGLRILRLVGTIRVITYLVMAESWLAGTVMTL